MRYTTLFLLCFAFACTRQLPVNTTQTTLQHKSEPYQWLAWQRAWPDTVFDWRGWQNTLAEVRLERAYQQKGGAGPCDPGPAAGWTFQGPSNVAGRVNTLALHPNNDSFLLAGFSGGGIFKTTDAGANWTPVFDDQPELAIGDITFDPQQPNVVYAGTGDPNTPFNVFNGRGLYRSLDGGDTWHYLALEQHGILSKVVVDHSNSQVLYAASMGNPYIRDNERGVYKSTDGGLSWSQVLFVSNQAGASDLVMDPSNPQVLYASFWDRIRSNQESIVYGPNARVYKTTDGGATWTQLGGGLPTGILGRTGLTISPQNPQKLYAVYVDTFSKLEGVYLTTDGGTSWTPLNTLGVKNAYADFGWYFGKVRINPTNDNEVYLPGVSMWRQIAGNSAWTVAANAHADVHDLVFGAGGIRYLGCDGGVYVNAPNQQFWTMCVNLPTTQVYRATYNPNFTDRYFLGAQDNGIKHGNHTDLNGWQTLFGADGFRCAFLPGALDTFWVEVQNGSIYKTIDGGLSWDGPGTALGTNDRVNWDMPFFLSQHQPDKLYAATYRVYVGYSSSGGWAPISPDLTDGVVYGPRFHTISCLEESPVLAEKLFVGTSDGNVWRREPNGGFIKVNGNLPDRYVTSVHGSPTLPNRIFVTQSGFRDNEEIPHIHRSDDNGATWQNISAGLPQVPVNDLFVVPQTADSILIAATDAGVFYSTNSGAGWQILGDNMPVIPVFHLIHNPQRNEVVAATFARGIWSFPLDSLQSQPPGNTPVALAGRLRTDDGKPIAKAGIYSSAGSNTQSSPDGTYELNSFAPCEPHSLRPKRNHDWYNGVSTYDMVLISKHILGLDTIDTPYRMLAADANRSGSITSFDIVALRRLILGIDTALAGTDSWRFVPADFSFPNPLNPFLSPAPDSIEVDPQGAPLSGLDFVGIKIGDLNSSAVTDFNQQVVEPRSNLEWPIGLENVPLEEKGTFEITLSGKLAELEALQLTIRSAAPGVIIESVASLHPAIKPDHFFLDGTLRLSTWPGAVQPDADLPPMPLLRLRVSAQNGERAGLLEIVDAPTPALAYLRSGEVRRPALVEFPASGSKWVQLTPNPVGDQGAKLLCGAAFECAIFDQAGKNLGVFEGQKGQSVHLPRQLFPGNGIYWCRIRFEGGDETVEKLVVQSE